MIFITRHPYFFLRGGPRFGKWVRELCSRLSTLWEIVFICSLIFMTAASMLKLVSWFFICLSASSLVWNICLHLVQKWLWLVLCSNVHMNVLKCFQSWIKFAFIALAFCSFIALIAHCGCPTGYGVLLVAMIQFNSFLQAPCFVSMCHLCSCSVFVS